MLTRNFLSRELLREIVYTISTKYNDGSQSKLTKKCDNSRKHRKYACSVSLLIWQEVGMDVQTSPKLWQEHKSVKVNMKSNAAC